MVKAKRIGIIGVGKFGYTLGTALVEQGQQVIGIDKSENALKQCDDLFDQVFQADATDQTAIEQLGIENLDFAIISVGENMDASILALLHLQEIGLEKIWVKAISVDHEKILRKMGADNVIFPEKVAAQQLAHQLSVPGLVELLPFWKGVVLREIEVEEWAGKPIKELNLVEKHSTQIVAIRKKGEKDHHFIPNPDKILEKGDCIILIGKEESLKKIEA